MTYSGSTPLRGTGVSTAAEIETWFADHAAAGASYVDLPAVPIPAGTGRAFVFLGRLTGINHDLAVGLVALESAYLQSQLARDKCNPSGYGAENDDPYGKAVTFPTLYEGLRATFAHLKTYVDGDNPFSDQYDLRYQNVVDAGWLGVVRVLTDLNGRWAFPGTSYGQEIAAYATSLTASLSGAATVVKPPVRTEYQSPNKNGYSPSQGGRKVVQAVVWHITQGADSRSWLASSAAQAGANYLIERDGTIYQLGDDLDEMWGNGALKEPDLSNPIVAGWVHDGINPNTRTICIEHEGFTSNNQGGSLTEAQVASSTWLTGYLCFAHGVPADRTHIIGHYQIDNVTRHYCPGFSPDEWSSMVGKVAAMNTGPIPTADANARKFATGHWIVNMTDSTGTPVNMLTFFDDQGGAESCGLPLEGMHLDPDNVYRQWCEYVLLECWPDGWGYHPGPFYKFGGAGQEVFRLRTDLAAARAELTGAPPTPPVVVS